MEKPPQVNHSEVGAAWGMADRGCWVGSCRAVGGPAGPSASWQAGSGCRMGSPWVAGGLGSKALCYGLEAPSLSRGKGCWGPQGMLKGL